MRTARYTHRETGLPFEVEYDEHAPCRWCGLPVIEASMGGTACCPWCDLGLCRFDRTHRVDREGFDPMTGKFREPRHHYATHHPDKALGG